MRITHNKLFYIIARNGVKLPYLRYRLCDVVVVVWGVVDVVVVVLLPAFVFPLSIFGDNPNLSRNQLSCETSTIKTTAKNNAAYIKCLDLKKLPIINNFNIL